MTGALTDAPDWSDRAIAKHVGVSNNFTSEMRRSLSSDDSDVPTDRTYTTKHGTTATMNVAGQKAAGDMRLKHGHHPDFRCRASFPG